MAQVNRLTEKTRPRQQVRIAAPTRYEAVSDGGGQSTELAPPGIGQVGLILMPLKMKKLLLAIVGLLMLSISLLAQERPTGGGTTSAKELFEFIEENIALNFSQQQVVSGWRQTGGYLESGVVAFNEIREAVLNNRISIVLPGDTARYTFVVKDFTQEAPDNYTWYGKLKEGYGYLFLLRRPEGFIGGIQTPTKYYSIAPLGKKFAFIGREYHSEMAVTDCGIDGTEAAQTSIPEICDEGFNTCPAVIDVLAIVTDGALAFLQNRFPDVVFDMPPLGQVQLPLWPLALEWAYANTNRALQNSDVPNKRFRFRTQIQNVPLTNNIATDTENIATNDIVQALRNQFRADLVVVFTNQNYNNIFGRVNGIGPDPAFVFTIVQVQFANAPRFSLAHELAHLFGARHNRTANVAIQGVSGDDAENCAHGWRFVDGDGIERRTIMALSGAINIDNPTQDVQQRSLLFSNPDIQIQGVTAGTPNDNNAQVIRNSGCFISQYMAQPEWSAYLNAPDVVCRNQLFFQACANVTPPGTDFPGVAPYTFEFYLSVDFQPEQLIGNTFCVNVTELQGDFLYLWVVVRSSDHQSITLSKVIEVREENSPPCIIPLRGTDSPAQITTYKYSSRTGINIFPNPTSGIISLSLNPDAEYYTHTSVLIADQCGKPVKHEIISPINTQYELDLSQYPAGVYFVRISWDTDSITHKIIKL